MITEESLLEKGWAKAFIANHFIGYEKETNGFFYLLTHLEQYDADLNYTIVGGNQYDWSLHIDNSKHMSVACLEVNSLEHIDLISQIYNNE